jgi:phosphoglycolate phosphatase-like HAD superfamily hydrolase
VADESDEALTTEIREFVTRLTGKQTVYQMIELAERIRRRGGEPADPIDYKHEYLDRLEERIRDRITGLETGRLRPEPMLIPGVIEFLEDLRRRGLTLHLASGTDEPFVRREAALLGVEEFFGPNIRGARDDFRSFSKKIAIEDILRRHRISGPELLGVGDGYVEIENTREVGGIALGLPTLEANPVAWDEWKKDRLILAGADALAPNFLELDPLREWLFPAIG